MSTKATDNISHSLTVTDTTRSRVCFAWFTSYDIHIMFFYC